MTGGEALPILYKILDSNGSLRESIIKDFQNTIWNEESVADDELDEILSDLAMDLDFYEPNPEYRKEHFSYYGDEKLDDLLMKMIVIIEHLIS